MKYVAEIITPEVNLRSAVYDSDSSFSVRIHDTDKKEDTIVDCQRLRRFTSVLGHSRTYRHDMFAVAAYNDATVQIFNHIASIETGARPDNTGLFDVCSFQPDGVVGKQIYGRPNLLIRILQHPYFGGKLGSVAQLDYEFIGRTNVYSLYDFLGMLCRNLDLNVMRYHQVAMYLHESKASVIRFKNTPESSRYFNKMLFDVMVNPK